MNPLKRPKENTVVEEEDENIKKAKTRKINAKEFEKKIESFTVWEQRKKEKIEKLQKEQKEKEMEKYNKNNIHNNKKISGNTKSTMIDRLYSKDINKRKENQMILTQIYTPSFTPFLYTKKGNNRKNPKKSDNDNIGDRRTHSQQHFKEVKGFNKMNYLKKNISKDDSSEDESEDDEPRNKNKNKKIYAKKALENLTNNNIKSQHERFSDNDDEESQRVIIENAYRKLNKR